MRHDMQQLLFWIQLRASSCIHIHCKFRSTSFFHNVFPFSVAFGDSKTDPGNKQAYLPYESRSERLPYGSTFFGHPSDRFCDGRLTIDFQAQAYGLTLLSPYARGLGSDFQHGANLAVSGSGCIPGVAGSAFHLTRQLNQFKKFRTSYEDKFVRDKSYISPNEYFGIGLYVISTGENDYRNAILNMGLTSKEIKSEMAPKVVCLFPLVLTEETEKGRKSSFFLSFRVQTSRDNREGSSGELWV
ncbi:hypothetical protein KP509_25G061700 [Ceratopteris richardii]|uniref:GDSL esterase/lipase n=1 Tax=Ceratopteris richardii TaxID=49495 RepID=A0A8T2RQY0_CERRI|nr:hypothetical protein KP509_25G061700 [Ceratopteris richardii]